MCALSHLHASGHFCTCCAQICAYFTAIRSAIKQHTFRALAATEDVMVWLLAPLDFRYIKDLQMAELMCKSYCLGWRAGSICEAKRKQFVVGAGSARADIKSQPDGSKVCHPALSHVSNASECQTGYPSKSSDLAHRRVAFLRLT